MPRASHRRWGAKSTRTREGLALVLDRPPEQEIARGRLTTAERQVVGPRVGPFLDHARQDSVLHETIAEAENRAALRPRLHRYTGHPPVVNIKTCRGPSGKRRSPLNQDDQPDHPEQAAAGGGGGGGGESCNLTDELGHVPHRRIFPILRR